MNIKLIFINIAAWIGFMLGHSQPNVKRHAEKCMQKNLKYVEDEMEISISN
jgi:hypothetical protein